MLTIPVHYHREWLTPKAVDDSNPFRTAFAGDYGIKGYDGVQPEYASTYHPVPTGDCGPLGVPSASFLSWSPAFPGGGIKYQDLKFGYWGKSPVRKRRDRSAIAAGEPTDLPWNSYMKCYRQGTEGRGVRSQTWTGAYGSLVTEHDSGSMCVDGFLAKLVPTSRPDDDPFFGVRLDLGIISEVALPFQQALQDLHSFEFYHRVKKEQVVDLGSTIVEIAEVYRLFAHAVSLLEPLFTDVRIIAAWLSSPMKIPTIIEALKHLASKWLLVQYAIVPLMETTWALLTKVPGAIKEEDGLNRLRFSTRSYENSRKLKLNYHQSVKAAVFGGEDLGLETLHCYFPNELIGGGSTRRIQIDGKDIINSVVGEGPPVWSAEGSVTAHVRSSWEAEVGIEHLLFKLGLNNPQTMLWEAIPFSFILDWFYKVGDFLSASQSLDGLKFHSNLMTTALEYEVSTSCGASGTASVCIRDLKKDMAYDFDVCSSLPWDLPGTLRLPLPTMQTGSMIRTLNTRAGNAAALLVLLSSALVDIKRLRAIEVPPYLMRKYLKASRVLGIG